MPTGKIVQLQDAETGATQYPVTTPTAIPGLSTVATSGSYNDLSDKPTIPAAQVQSDWAETNIASKAYIQNKPTIQRHDFVTILSPMTGMTLSGIVTNTIVQQYNSFSLPVGVHLTIIIVTGYRINTSDGGVVWITPQFEARKNGATSTEYDEYHYFLPLEWKETQQAAIGKWLSEVGTTIELIVYHPTCANNEIGNLVYPRNLISIWHNETQVNPSLIYNSTRRYERTSISWSGYTYYVDAPEWNGDATYIGDASSVLNEMRCERIQITHVADNGDTPVYLIE